MCVSKRGNWGREGERERERERERESLCACLYIIIILAALHSQDRYTTHAYCLLSTLYTLYTSRIDHIQLLAIIGLRMD